MYGKRVAYRPIFENVIEIKKQIEKRSFLMYNRTDIFCAGYIQ